MRGSRMSFGKKETGRNMACCSFTDCRILASFLLFSSLCCVCFAETEYIFDKSKVWENESASSGEKDFKQTGWIATSGSMWTCSNGARLTLRSLNTADAKRIFVEIEYKINQKFPGTGGLYLLSSMLSGPTSEASHEITQSLIGNTEGQEGKKTLHYNISEDDNYINLTLLGTRVCTTVEKISVFYYVCPRNNTLMVARTTAPRSGFIEASTKCSIKQSEEKVSVVVAKCGSDGEWRKVQDKEGACVNDCGPGHELNNDTCTVCKDNYYKDTRGVHACMKCPENTVSEEDHTRCRCIKHHYRNTANGTCKTIPSRPRKLSYIRLPFNTIVLHWNISQKDIHAHQGLQFRVKCQQYRIIDKVSRPCQNLSLGEKGMNVSSSPLEVKYLRNNTNYTFTVVAMNDVSAQVSQEHWRLAMIHVHLPGSFRTHAPKSSDTTSETPVPSTPVSTPVTTTRTTPAVVRSDHEKSTVVLVPSTTSTSSEGNNEETVEPEESNPTTELAPYIGIAIGAILFILVLIVIVHYRRKRTKKKTLESAEGFPLNPGQQAYVDPTKYGNPEKAVRRFAKEIDRREIRLEGLIGEGEFAKVHKGMLCRANEPPVAVALKVLKPGSSAKNREDFLTEAAVMGQFKDMNIVMLEGVVTISHPVMIITEFMHNGALSDYLVKYKNRFSEIELLGMARGIASGMKYLARMRFVHRDLAARNVLVNENLVCKVADFGLTRELEESCQGEYVTQGGKIPIRWTAPEAYKHRRFTTASDVWSYGIVLWEIMSYAERPYGNWDNYMVMDQVTANYRLFAPTNCPKIVHQLMMECWKADRSQRPSFSDIVEMLERWIRNPYLLKDYQYVTEKDRMADRKSCIAKSIREYLEAIKMDRYIENFIDFGYTELYQIQNLTDDDLVGIGVPLVGHRNKIIKSLRGERELLLPVDV